MHFEIGIEFGHCEKKQKLLTEAKLNYHTTTFYDSFVLNSIELGICFWLLLLTTVKCSLTFSCSNRCSCRSIPTFGVLKKKLKYFRPVVRCRYDSLMINVECLSVIGEINVHEFIVEWQWSLRWKMNRIKPNKNNKKQLLFALSVRRSTQK